MADSRNHFSYVKGQGLAAVPASEPVADRDTIARLVGGFMAIRFDSCKPTTREWLLDCADVVLAAVAQDKAEHAAQVLEAFVADEMTAHDPDETGCENSCAICDIDPGIGVLSRALARATAVRQEGQR